MPSANGGPSGKQPFAVGAAAGRRLGVGTGRAADGGSSDSASRPAQRTVDDPALPEASADLLHSPDGIGDVDGWTLRRIRAGPDGPRVALTQIVN
ncbi:hypothetical protein GCM10010358_71280 [Streptomyces minutiscleroticus]|uniref:Uncharacterized protein n=1 Tax=Streptomyces minutiscleroticus TaxID=68238 RepID=A0A918U808_9ACTN|nr:hypothetical protein GCM10010358_71280 [Streptomyces minutiscleroticus]